VPWLLLRWGCHRTPDDMNMRRAGRQRSALGSAAELVGSQGAVVPGENAFRLREGAAMPAVLFVRIKSKLDPEDLDRRLLERRPRFVEVPGLSQKIYGRDHATGDVCGIYFFETEAALAAFRKSDSRRRLPARTKLRTSAAKRTTCCTRCAPRWGRSPRRNSGNASPDTASRR